MTDDRRSETGNRSRVRAPRSSVRRRRSRLGRPTWVVSRSVFLLKTTPVAMVLNALGFALCVAGIGLLVFRNRIVTREVDLRIREARLDAYFMGRHWLDLGVGSLVTGFLLQIIAAVL